MPCWTTFRTYLIPFIFLFNPAFSQSQDSTIASVKIPTDSSYIPKYLNHSPVIHIENYRQSFLNFQNPDYDLFISRIPIPDTLPYADSYRFGLNSFPEYMNLSSNNLNPDTGKSISRLSLILGTKKEQLLFIDHKQKLGKHLIAGINYNSLTSEGFLFHQFGKSRAFGTSFNYDRRKYKLEGKYDYHKVEAEENGGIVSGQNINGIARSDYGLLELNLTDALTKIKRHHAELNQSISLFGNSTDSVSGSQLFLNLNSSYTAFGHSYTASFDSSFYTNFYINPDSTKDTSSYNNFLNSVSLNYLFTSADRSLSSSFKAGLSRNDVNERLQDFSRRYFYFSPFIKALFQWNSFSLNADLRLVKSNSIKNNDRSIVLDLSKNFSLRFLNAVNFNYQSSSLSPATISSFYYSNHFIWVNNFEKERVNKINASLTVFNNHVKLFANYSVYDHKIFFNGQALPQQLNSTCQLVDAGFVFDTHLGHFNFYSSIDFQNSNTDVIRVPDFKTYSRLSYKNYFFKKALLAEFGLAGIYTSAYKANAYMPATGIYYLQNEQTIGDVPTIHFFANLEIGPAIIFLKVENLSNNLFDGDNFATPYYPVPPRTFKLGIRWLLRN